MYGRQDHRLEQTNFPERYIKGRPLPLPEEQFVILTLFMSRSNFTLTQETSAKMTSAPQDMDSTVTFLAQKAPSTLPEASLITEDPTSTQDTPSQGTSTQGTPTHDTPNEDTPT